MKQFTAIFDDRKRAALALDFCADSIVLRHAPPEQDWAEIGVVALDAPDFETQLAALRDLAADANAGDLTTELWLPGQQVVNAYIPEGQTDPSVAITAQTGLPMAELVYDISPAAAGGSVACVAERSVVAEAQLYAAKWGFSPGLVTTRYADAAFAAPPVLAAPPRNRRRIAAWLAAAASVAFLITGGVFMMAGDEAQIEPPKVALEKVTTAPGRVAEPTPLADVLREPVVETDQTSPAETSPAHGGLAPALADGAGTPDGGGAKLNFSLLTQAPALGAALSPAQPGGAPAQMTPVHLSFRHPGSAAPPPPEQYALHEAPIVPPSPQQGQAPVADVALNSPEGVALSPVQNRVAAPMTFAAPVVLARQAIAGIGQNEALTGQDPAVDAARPDRNAAHAIGYSPSLAYGAGAIQDEEIPSSEDIALALPTATSPLQTIDEAQRREASLTTEHEEILTDADDLITGDELAEDTGPSDLAPLSAPVQKRRPDKLDMTPTEFAVLSAPAPDKRPPSIIARPRRVDRPASAQRRIGPTGPALARAATVRDALALDEVSLLGVFGSVKTRRALLRMPDGAVLRVAKGDVVEGWLITSIERSKLNISRGGQAKTLKVPR